MKLLFVGYGRAGKDTAAKHLAKITGHAYGGSTSWAALPDVAEALRLHPMEAWETRHDMRVLWKGICDGLRVHDPALLIRRAQKTGDFVAGCRDIVELRASRRENLFDKIIWIENSRVQVDPTVTFDSSHCDIVIHNNGTLEEFHALLAKLGHALGILVDGGTASAPTTDIYRE